MKICLLGNSIVYIASVVAMFMFMVANPNSSVKAAGTVEFVTIISIMAGSCNLLALIFLMRNI
jgi:hypothetical protein